VAVETFLAQAVRLANRRVQFTRAYAWINVLGLFAPFSRGIGLLPLGDRIVTALVTQGRDPSPLVVSVAVALVPALTILAIGSWLRVGYDIPVILAVFSFVLTVLPDLFLHLPVLPRGVSALRDDLAKDADVDATLTIPQSARRGAFWRRYVAASPNNCVVYGRELPDTAGLVLQYWIYYLYNDWANRHESDWECVTVVLNRGESIPRGAAYSAHFGGYWRDWPDVSRQTGAGVLDQEGTHPVVYVARGSHAQYFGPRMPGYMTMLGARLFTGETITMQPGRRARRHRDRVPNVPAELLPQLHRVTTSSVCRRQSRI
jgi:hypothetical protein